MYTFDSRVRYSETDSEGRLTMEALLNYFQDCSTFQSEDLGVGIRYLKEKNRVWVLSSWQIVVDRFPELCEHITVGTFPYDFKGCFGLRNFFMKDTAGNFLAKANTIWTLIDTESFKPVRVGEEFYQKYQFEEKLDMEYAGRKVADPVEGHLAEEIVVRAQHLDVNHHVNNGQYVGMAMEFLPEGFKITQMRAEYRRQAFLHDVLHPYVSVRKKENDGEAWTVSLQDADGGVYVNVEFEGKR